jgi:phosphatidylinositol N-acetylglucosaminyltransferase subunit A
MLSKENTVLRAALNPKNVSVIPNAVVASQFTPDPRARDPNWITVVVISRLVYRKGIDLLAAIIPSICDQNPRVRFLIAGDGPKRLDLEQMREKYMLQDRVELLGAVKHSQVREVLVQGQIFLNTSLTEAFCIGIVEAACCGLLIVSTRVGGVPEVLPRHMILFGKPDVAEIVMTVNRAVQMIRGREINTLKFHDEVRRMYSWMNIAERTEKVYYQMVDTPPLPLIERLRRYYGCGVWAGKLFCVVVVVNYMWWMLLEWLYPRDQIDIMPDFNLRKYEELSKNQDEDDAGSSPSI